MQEENLNQVGEKEQQPAELQQQTTAISATDLSPLNIIRTETVISRLPIHNLAKKGRINIQIVRKTPKGEIDLKWEVSYSDRFGQPRQIAYKLDTIVINRKIEEGGRPLPEFIRLGSLRDVAKDLGLGSNAMLVKKALFQNASAFINAKFKYKSNDGTERSLQAGFTRYSVIFTGEKFPDGRKADAVYIRLNPEYRDVLNNAPVRPLDYDYLKALPPGAQRFYEIVSRKIFAAIKYEHPRAKLSYSEFCTFSAQQRQRDYDHFKKQMYKVHRPHIKSGYITKVEYEMCTDEEGKPDWIMLYTPGEKARAEFQTFNGLPASTRRRRKSIHSVDEKSSATRSTPALLPSAQSGKESVDQKLCSELTARGVFETAAVKLLSSCSPEQLEKVGDFIDYWDRLPADKRGAGLLLTLIQNNDPLPPTFETRRQRTEREAAADRNRKLTLVKQELQIGFEEHCRQVIDRHIADQVPLEEFERRVAAQKAEDAKQPGLWGMGKRPEFADSIARHAVRKEIARGVVPPSYDDFRRRQLPRILADLKLDPAELGIELPPAPPPIAETTP